MNNIDVLTNLINHASVLREDYIVELNRTDNMCYNNIPTVEMVVAQKNILADKLHNLEVAVKNIKIYSFNADLPSLSIQVRNRLDVLRCMF